MNARPDSIVARRPGLWLGLTALLIFPGLVRLQKGIDAQKESLHLEREELLLSSGGLFHRISLGYDSLLADIYWTRVVQHYGTNLHNLTGHFELLDPLLDITTDLDPHLLVAYEFGAIFLAEPGRAGADTPERSVRLVEKGIAANPSEWRLYHLLGFVYYWYLKDYPKSSAAYLAGSRVPGAPNWMRLMAARVAEVGSSYDTSRMIWAQVYETAPNDRVRKAALEHLKTLRAEQDVAALEKLVEEYRLRFHHLPQSTADLVMAGLLRGRPLDPAGYPYLLGPDGKIRLDPRSPIHPGVLNAPAN